VISDDYVDRAIYYLENIRDCQFSLGDLLMELVDLHDGYKSGVVLYMAGKTGISASTLYDYEAVSRRWSPTMRLVYPHLDWSIYRNSDPIRDKELLDRALEENMNATKFKELMYPAILEPSKILQSTIRQLGKVNLTSNQKEQLNYIMSLLQALLSELGQ
jgi:hypothetical protein